MKVKIIKSYYDTTMGNKLIKAGTELEVSAERKEKLIKAGVAKVVEEKPKKSKK